MKTNLLDKNKICILLDSSEMNFSCASCKDKNCRERLKYFYKCAAEKYGLTLSPKSLLIQMYPFLNDGCMVIYTAQKKRYKSVSREFFRRFEHIDDLLDCKRKIKPLCDKISSSELYLCGGVYYVRICAKSKTRALKQFLSEYSTDKCCQKKQFYKEFGQKIADNIFT